MLEPGWEERRELLTWLVVAGRVKRPTDDDDLSQWVQLSLAACYPDQFPPVPPAVVERVPEALPPETLLIRLTRMGLIAYPSADEADVRVLYLIRRHLGNNGEHMLGK